MKLREKAAVFVDLLDLNDDHYDVAEFVAHGLAEGHFDPNQDNGLLFRHMAEVISEMVAQGFLVAFINDKPTPSLTSNQIVAYLQTAFKDHPRASIEVTTSPKGDEFYAAIYPVAVKSSI